MSEARAGGDVLRLEAVTRSYRKGHVGEIRVLAGVDLAIRRGEVVGLVAPSGTGKSTLLHIAGLLDSPDEGQVVINGTDFASAPDGLRTRVRRREVGFVYQFHHLLPEFSALENVVLPQLAADAHDELQGNQRRRHLVQRLHPDGSNPCRHVKRYKESKRERFLSPEETERLGEVLAEAESEMPSAVTAFRLLLLTGCRLSEIQFLRREYVRDDCIELPDAKTGGGSCRSGPKPEPCWPTCPARRTIPGSSAAGCRAPTSPISSAPGDASAPAPG